jgi:hypothetical protein
VCVLGQRERLKNWSSLRDAKCVLYDTKHGTNKYKLKLGCWTIVDHNGDTQIIAFSLVIYLMI